MKYLFSPVGATDPMKGGHDGSLLHICRKYMPDVVYLYLTKEMVEREELDHRFTWALEELGKELGHTFKCKKIERRDFSDPDDYDKCYDDIIPILKEIGEKLQPGDQLIANMASGTPAMKSALHTFAAFTELPFLSVRVATPLRKCNSKDDNYDKVLEWQNNTDNKTESYVDRCHEEMCRQLYTMLKIKIIKKHIDAYDYSAALNVAKTMHNLKDTDALKILEMADSRAALDHKSAMDMDPENSFDIFPVTDDENVTEIFEYVLALDLKKKRGELADFLRAITPVSYALLKLVLKRKCNIDIDKYIKTDNHRPDTWDKELLETDGLYAVLEEGYKKKAEMKASLPNNPFREAFNKNKKEFMLKEVYSDNLRILIKEKCRDESLKQDVWNLVEVEHKARNKAAHTIVSVSNKWVEERTGRSPTDIIKLIKKISLRCGVCSEKDWDSYDSMNEKIKRALDKI